MPKHDMTKMNDSNAGNHDSMGMNMSGSDKDNDRVFAIDLQLEQMRTMQRQLNQAYQREKDAQKKEDSRAFLKRASWPICSSLKSLST